MLVVQNSGVDAILQTLINTGLVLRLYSNDVTPKTTDKPETYTEVSGGGYKSRMLAPSAWAVKNGVAICKEEAFAFMGRPRVPIVYGYTVWQDNTLLWAQRLPDAFPVAVKGDTLIISPTLALRAAK